MRVDGLGTPDEVTERLVQAIDGAGPDAGDVERGREEVAGAADG